MSADLDEPALPKPSQLTQSRLPVYQLLAHICVEKHWPHRDVVRVDVEQGLLARQPEQSFLLTSSPCQALGILQPPMTDCVPYLDDRTLLPADSDGQVPELISLILEAGAVHGTVSIPLTGFKRAILVSQARASVKDLDQTDIEKVVPSTAMQPLGRLESGSF